MRLQILERTQFLPIPLAQAWDYFSSPVNLPEITPAYMRFKILNVSGEGKMYPGQIISYTVRPVAGIPLYWVTEITQVRDQAFFIDEQRFGPYAFWHHSHFFKAVEGGVEMKDLVHYKIPFGIFGRIAHGLFVRKQLEGVFDYRKEVLERKFV